MPCIKNGYDMRNYIFDNCCPAAMVEREVLKSVAYLDCPRLTCAGKVQMEELAQSTMHGSRTSAVSGDLSTTCRAFTR